MLNRFFLTFIVPKLMTMTNPLKTIVFLVLFFDLIGHVSTFAQNSLITFTLSGYVTTGNHEKLPGVNVYIKGTSTGTVTNEDGFYSLKLPEGNTTIVYSFIGYQTIEKTISNTHSMTSSHTMSGNRTLNIMLEPNEEMLQEISITSQRKFFGNMDYGRDIPTVKSEEIEKLNTTNASDILHARLSGVWATKTSGAPGDQQKIRIRGQASFFSSAEPLYVIDGVPVPIVNLASLGIGDLNMHDIESVTVLKDASSTALYGYQGGNGVVLIDTKQNSENKLDFSYRKGIQWFNNYYDLMNSKDFLESLQLAKDNIKSPIYQYYPEYSDTLCDHNRQDEIFQMGKLQEYQLSGGGKMKNTTYYLSGNYTNHVGILKGSEHDKFNFTARVGTTIKNRLAISGSYRWSYQENLNNQNEYMGNRLIFEGISKAPCLECTPDALLYNPSDNRLWNRNNVSYELFNELTTPQQIMDNSKHSYNYYSNAASLMVRYSISKEINIDLMESMMIRNSSFETQANYDLVYYNSRSSSYIIQSTPTNMKSDERVALLNHQVNFSYNKILDRHELNLSLANRFYADNVWWHVDSLKQSIPKGFYFKNSMAGVSKDGSIIRKIGSYIAHFSYNYDEKYFASAIVNYSRVQEGKHIDYYTLFPSLSLNWDISNEPFFQTINWFDELSFYANYGSSGNYPLNGFANDTYEQAYGQFAYSYYNADPTHLVVKQFANHNLRHESNSEFDLGYKASILNKKFSLNGLFFTKAIGNQIVLREIPYYYVGGKAFVNIGDIDVRGIELGFEAFPIETKNINWSITGNYSASTQKVKLLADHQDMQFISTDLFIPDFIIKEGQPLGDIYGYKIVGVWTEQDNLANDINYLKFGNYKVLNADTLNPKLDKNDKTVIGNSIPDFNWNLMSSFSYKDFSLDLVLYSIWGIQKYNATNAATFASGINSNLNRFYADSSNVIKSYIFYQSSYFIEDASFIRLKTITLSYHPTQKVLGFDFQISLSFENLFTITKYGGYDPEATIYTDNNFSDNAIDKGAFPNPKSVFFTLNLTF